MFTDPQAYDVYYLAAYGTSYITNIPLSGNDPTSTAPIHFVIASLPSTSVCTLVDDSNYPYSASDTVVGSLNAVMAPFASSITYFTYYATNGTAQSANAVVHVGVGRTTNSLTVSTNTSRCEK